MAKRPRQFGESLCGESEEAHKHTRRFPALSRHHRGPFRPWVDLLATSHRYALSFSFLEHHRSFGSWRWWTSAAELGFGGLVAALFSFVCRMVLVVLSFCMIRCLYGEHWCIIVQVLSFSLEIGAIGGYKRQRSVLCDRKSCCAGIGFHQFLDPWLLWKHLIATKRYASITGDHLEGTHR